MFKKTRERIKKLEQDHESIHKVVQHFDANKDRYIFGAGGATITFVVMKKFGGQPLIDASQNVRQNAKNQALINWKPEINQIALVKRACPEPIPVLDTLTGESYASLRRAAKITGETLSTISKDAHGLQERFALLPESVLA